MHLWTGRRRMTALAAVGLLGLTLSACGGSSTSLSAAHMNAWVKVADTYSSASQAPDNYCLSLTTADLTAVYAATTPPNEPPATLYTNSQAALNCNWDWSSTQFATLAINQKANQFPLSASGYFMHYTPSVDDANTIPASKIQAMIVKNLAGPVPTTPAQLARYSQYNG